MKAEVTKNILEIASMYDVADGIWWRDHDIFPSKAEFRSFKTMQNDWDKWIEEHVEIENTFYSIRANDAKIKLRRATGYFKGDKHILISWRINHDVGKGKAEISGLDVRFHESLSPRFTPSVIEETLLPIKLEEEKKSQVYMVVQRHHGLDLQDFNIDIPTLDVEMNYGPEWLDKHNQLLDALSGSRKKGIALLHGLPGTGKSMYIRHMIATIAESKTVIYLPNQLINNITDPSFIPLMAEYSGAVLIIEDADEAIKSRKTGGGIVDKLLNLADGILSDFLGMQIICTFNNDISTIDDALLRKGRLILKHQFDKLSIEASQKLSNHLGFKTKIDEPMTLAEIYNQEDKLSDIEKKERKIGFR
jgi:hypothetical protein